MSIEGQIIAVMEIWPLQLTVQTPAGRYHVQLLLETSVTRSGRVVPPGELAPGLAVRIAGQPSGAADSAMAAESVQIVD